MEPIPVSPVAYASPPTPADQPPVALRTAVAAGWLVTILAVTASAFDAFGLAQAQAAYVSRVLFASGSLDAMDRVLRWAVGPAASAAVFGMFAAAALWHWPRHRLAWAIVVPVAAAVWTYFDPLTTAGRSSYLTTPLTSAVLLTALQCGGVYAGTRCGRAVARWLANQLLPPSLRAAVVPLWTQS